MVQGQTGGSDEPTGDDPASSSPFHAQPVNFGLDYVDFLSPAQLALAWIAHPDYDPGMAARPIRKAWAKAREQATAQGKVGKIIITPGERGDWPEFAAIDLNWRVPTLLDNLRSEQLAVSQQHV